MRRLACVLGLLLSLASTAVADSGDDDEDSTRGTHLRQFGLYVQPGIGYRVLFPYNSEFCGQMNKSVCVGRSPIFLEVGANYGVTRSLELIADVRLGVEGDFVPPGSTADAPTA